MKTKKLLLQWNPAGCNTVELAAENIFDHCKRRWEQEKLTPSPEPISDMERLAFKVIASKNKNTKKRKKIIKKKKIKNRKTQEGLIEMLLVNLMNIQLHFGMKHTPNVKYVICL